MNTQCITGRLPATGQAGTSAITVDTFGSVSEAQRVHVHDQLASVARSLPGNPGLRVKLTAAQSVDKELVAVVQANLQIDGWLMARTHIASGDFGRATELTASRLSDHLRRATDPYAVRQWPEAPTRGRPEPAAVPAAQRRITRAKRFMLMCSDPAEAALLMDAMDYDFHLFISSDTGEDSVVYRVGPTGYRLASLHSVTSPIRQGVVPWTVNVHPVPNLTAHQAVTRLNDTELPFRFFRNAETGRGAVIYRRLDGHYGLICPGTPTGNVITMGSGRPEISAAA